MSVFHYRLYVYGSVIEGSEVIRKEFAKGWERMSAVLALEVNIHQLLFSLHSFHFIYCKQKPKFNYRAASSLHY